MHTHKHTLTHSQSVYFLEMLDLQKYLHQVIGTHVPSIVDKVLNTF